MKITSKTLENDAQAFEKTLEHVKRIEEEIKFFKETADNLIGLKFDLGYDMRHSVNYMQNHMNNAKQLLKQQINKTRKRLK